MIQFGWYSNISKSYLILWLDTDECLICKSKFHLCLKVGSMTLLLTDRSISRTRLFILRYDSDTVAYAVNWDIVHQAESEPSLRESWLIPVRDILPCNSIYERVCVCVCGFMYLDCRLWYERSIRGGGGGWRWLCRRKRCRSWRRPPSPDRRHPRSPSKASSGPSVPPHPSASGQQRSSAASAGTPLSPPSWSPPSAQSPSCSCNRSTGSLSVSSYYDDRSAQPYPKISSSTPATGVISAWPSLLSRSRERVRVGWSESD